MKKPLPKGDDREDYIELIESLLSERQEKLPGVTAPEGATEQKLAKELVAMNQVINQRLDALKGEIKMNINTLKKRKQTRKKYESPYDGPTADGVFFDSKN